MFIGSALVDDLGIDDVIVVDRAGTSALTCGRARRRGTGGVGVAGRGLVQLLAERLAGRHQRLGGRADRRGVVALECLLEVTQRALDGRTLVGGDLVTLV